MIPVRQARDTILEAVGCLGTERVPVLDALGRVCAEEVVADITIPPLDNTAMDGFAVRAADTRGAAPERPAALRILRDLAAGSVSDVAVGPGEAIRIMT
ncbi:MAG: molybdopterin molybdenumtransferase MoeA, partial [Myxococcales bacterium]|nr:molybdopterin molybdenumtransferase MoeA [Myxococcales bacterium]